MNCKLWSNVQYSIIQKYAHILFLIMNCIASHFAMMQITYCRYKRITNANMNAGQALTVAFVNLHKVCLYFSCLTYVSGHEWSLNPELFYAFSMQLLEWSGGLLTGPNQKASPSNHYDILIPVKSKHLFLLFYHLLGEKQFA